MSQSEQRDRLAVVSSDDQATIGGLVDKNWLDIVFTDWQTTLETAQEMLRGSAQYTEPASIVQRVGDHPALIIGLQKEIPDLRAQQSLPHQCDHTELGTRMQVPTTEPDEARRKHEAPGTEEELREELSVITRDALQSGKEVHSLRTQWARALPLAAGTIRADPLARAQGGQKFPDTLGCSGSDRTQLVGYIAQLRMVVQHNPANCPDKQSKMRYAFNRLRGASLGQIVPPIPENQDIGREGLPAFLWPLEAAFGDPNQMAMAERRMQEIKQ